MWKHYFACPKKCAQKPNFSHLCWQITKVLSEPLDVQEIHLAFRQLFAKEMSAYSCLVALHCREYQSGFVKVLFESGQAVEDEPEDASAVSGQPEQVVHPLLAHPKSVVQFD